MCRAAPGLSPLGAVPLPFPLLCVTASMAGCCKATRLPIAHPRHLTRIFKDRHREFQRGLVLNIPSTEWVSSAEAVGRTRSCPASVWRQVIEQDRVNESDPRIPRHRPGPAARVPTPTAGATNPRALRRAVLPPASPLREHRREEVATAPVDRRWQCRDQRRDLR